MYCFDLEERAARLDEELIAPVHYYASLSRRRSVSSTQFLDSLSFVL